MFKKLVSIIARFGKINMVRVCPKCGFKGEDLTFCPSCGYDTGRR